MVSLLGGAGRFGGLVVDHEFGVVLVGLTAHESVVAVEAPTERPLVPRAARRHLGSRSQVPLAHGERGVALPAENLREEAVLLGDGGVVAGEPRGELHHAGHAVGVMVPPGEQAGPRGGAQGGGVEVGIATSLRRQAVEGRRGDVGSVGAELGVAHVVEEHDDHVGGAGGRRGEWWPPSPRVSERPTDLPFECFDHGRVSVEASRRGRAARRRAPFAPLRPVGPDPLTKASEPAA